MGEASRIAVVTGANRGIGFEVCRQLAQAGATVILTARNESRGVAARNILVQEGLIVDFHTLAVTQFGSISRLVQYVGDKYGKLDILINNAGILPDEDTQGLIVPVDVVRTVFEVNTLGPLQVSQQLIPLLQKSSQGKIINVSSGLGSLSDMEGGYAAYRISKAALNAVTRILASELQATAITVNSVCPGWVRTDMGGPHAQRSVEEGAHGIVQLALLQKNIPNGKFLRDLKPIAW